MYISKSDRLKIYGKFDGKCAYSGTELLDDWQVDHIEPIKRCQFLNKVDYPERHNIDNMVPCQRVINHYKGTLTLDLFREWYLGGLHKRLAKLPKSPKVEKSIKKKAYLLEVARFFDIEPEKPFCGVFYFETL